MKPPAAIEVGATVYQIKRDAIERRGLLGETDKMLGVIRLDPTQAPDIMRDTLLHEVLHAVTEMCGLCAEWGDRKDETVIRRMTGVLLDTLRRNPELVAYLTA